jgi:hypothetical protein
MCLKKNPTNHHRNVIQFEKNQKTFIQININFWKKIYLIMYVIESTLKINF